MDKYTGMHKVETKVTENRHATKNKKTRSGYLKTLLVQAAIALCVGVALFAGKLYGGKTVRNIAEKVREAVCFDAFDTVAVWIEDR